MKRKVNLVGSNTLTVSLPSKWVKNTGIRKGDEVDIAVNSDELIISAENIKEESSIIKIDIKGYEGAVIMRSILAAYMLGFDEIELVNADEYTEYKGKTSVKSIVDKIGSGLIGFEVISHSDKRYLLKEVASSKGEDFSAVSGRIMFLLNDMLVQIEGILESKNQGVDAINDIEGVVNRLCNYCIRVINKKEIGSRKNSTVHHSIIIKMELLGDSFEKLAADACGNGKLRKEVCDMFKEIKNQFELFFKCFLNFDVKKINEITINHRKIISKLASLESLSQKESKVLQGYRSIIDNVQDTLNELIMLEQCKEFS